MGDPRAGRLPVGAAFAVPAFRWYWGSQLLSGVGTWAQALAQSWLVLQLTGSPIALGAVTTAQFLPMLVFPLIGGVIADRVPRRRLLMTTQTAAMIQAVVLGLLVWSGTVMYPEVVALAFVYGLTNAFGNPAQQALVPELVGRELVPNAVALNSVQFNVARLAGGAAGGVAVATLGIAGTLFVNAASYLPAIAVLALIRPAHVLPRGTRTRMRGEIVTGLRYAVDTPAVRRVLALFGIVGLLGFNWAVAIPLLASALHVGPTGFGGLTSAFGGGSLIAGLLLMRNREATDARLAAGGIAMGAMLILIGLSSWYVVSLGLMVAAGLAGVTASVTANTRLQLLTPDAYRGRVMSLYVMLLGGTTPIGALLLGGIAEAWGIQAGLMVFGTLTILGLAAILLLGRGRPADTPTGPGVARSGEPAVRASDPAGSPTLSAPPPPPPAPRT